MDARDGRTVLVQHIDAPLQVERAAIRVAEDRTQTTIGLRQGAGYGAGVDAAMIEHTPRTVD